MAKSVLRTIRFSPGEMAEIKVYLKNNPTFESISSLGRVAVMEFTRTKRKLPLHPNVEFSKKDRPLFLWDYELTETEVEETLTHAPFEQKKWLIGRILEHASLNEVFRYLTLEQIQKALPHLRMNSKNKRHWQGAIELWMKKS